MLKELVFAWHWLMSTTRRSISRPLVPLQWCQDDLSHPSRANTCCSEHLLLMFQYPKNIRRACFGQTKNSCSCIESKWPFQPMFTFVFIGCITIVHYLIENTDIWAQDNTNAIIKIVQGGHLLSTSIISVRLYYSRYLPRYFQKDYFFSQFSYSHIAGSQLVIVQSVIRL